VKKQPQDYNGCVLATIAVLADIPFVEAEGHAKVATKHLGLTWKGSWWSVFGYLGREDAIALARETAIEAGLRRFTPITRVGEALESSARTSPDLSGRGQISVALPAGGHSMAYADGFIYDSDYLCVEKETWEEYVTRRGSDILKVVVTPYKE